MEENTTALKEMLELDFTSMDLNGITQVFQQMIEKGVLKQLKLLFTRN